MTAGLSLDPAQVTTPAPHGKRWTLQEAFQYCENLAGRHYENFPVSGRWIPVAKRKHVCAIYAFARIADDFADEASHGDASERLGKLSEWREQLEDCYQRECQHPVFLALGETVRRFAIPIELPGALLKAFEQDVRKNRYRTFAEVLDYCQNSANPVGRLVLHLFDYRQEDLFKLSDNICTGLQLANLWQDVAIDLKKDRIYLPLEEQAHFGVNEQMLRRGEMTLELKRLMAFQVARTEELFHRGRQLPVRVGKDLSFQLRLVWLGGMRILDKLRQVQYDFFRHRPVITIGDKLLLLWRAFCW